MSAVSTFEALKKAFTTALVLTHLIPDTQITVKTDTSDYTMPLSFWSQLQMVSCIWLHSTPRLFLLWNSTTMSMKRAPGKFWSFQHGDITSKALDFWSCGHQSLELAILFNNQNPHVLTSTMVQIPFQIQAHHLFPSRTSAPNPMHLLDNGISILKRGIVTIPVSTHRTSALYSLLSNWHHRSELLPCLYLSWLYCGGWYLFQHDDISREMFGSISELSCWLRYHHHPALLMMDNASTCTRMTPSMSDWIHWFLHGAGGWSQVGMIRWSSRCQLLCGWRTAEPMNLETGTEWLVMWTK